MSIQGHRAAIAEEAAVLALNENDPPAKKQPFWLRMLLKCVPKTPDSADGWTNVMAISGTILIPVWFYLAHKWNPSYVPIRAPVWSVPWLIAFFWFGIQMLFLSISMQKSTDEIRFREILIAFLPLLSCTITLTVMVVLWVVGIYQLGGFQLHEMVAFISAAVLNASIGGGVRFALKGKIFGQLGAVNNN